MSLNDLLKFNDLLLRFGRVERVVRLPESERMENDVEHSYALTMLAWYLIERDKVPLDKDLVLKYALVHDFVEVHAGDVFFYASDAERAAKVKREAEAQERLKKEHPEFGDLHRYIERYHAQEDAESRFIKALDKLCPMFVIYADNGRTWKETGVTLKMLLEKKLPFMEQSPEVMPYFTELIETLKRKPELFAHD